MSAFPTPFDRLTDLRNLLAGVHKLSLSSSWKASVQRILVDRLRFCTVLRRSLIDGTYEPKPGYTFTVSERGHRRLIRALDPADMVLQHTLCDTVLMPALKPYLIHDNGASIKGKGMAFTRRRLERHLGEFYRHYGTDGYVLQTDFAKFFDNIPHKSLIASIDSKVRDGRIADLLRRLLRPYCPAVPDASVYDTIPYNSLTDTHTGSQVLHRSVGIGAPLSQTAGVWYPTPIDTYCKVVRSCRWYGRYMDDIYIIAHDRNFLMSVMDGIRQEARRLGLFISERKTHITPIRQGFTFCKIRYSLTPSGKVVRRPARETFTRERRRLRKLYKLASCGKISISDYKNLYRSWRQSWTDFDCHRSITETDKIYRRLLNDLLD